MPRHLVRSARAALAVAAVALAGGVLGVPCLPAHAGGSPSESGLTHRREAVGRPGRWRAARDLRESGELTEKQRKEIERLRSIGYVGGVNVATGQTGVTIHDRERAQDGLGFYTSGHFAGAHLVDMDGNILHTWEFPFAKAWPEARFPDQLDIVEHWRRAYLFENGDVLAIFEGHGIIKIDRDSELIWARLNGSHHDLEVQTSGRIYVLTRHARIVPEIHEARPTLEDFVTVLDADGTEIERVSIIDAFKRSRFVEVLMRPKTRFAGDITHTNTIEVLDGRLSDRLPEFRDGNVLVSFRKLDAIAVIDLDLEEVVWVAHEGWIGQHQPTVLESGNVLLFDNGNGSLTSEVVEFDPVTFETRWSYEGDPPNGFFSKSCGSNQRLANGNTLISESDNGRAFEVTPAGEVVWEYWNPERAGESDEFIATIFEMIRLEADFPVDWLDGR